MQCYHPLSAYQHKSGGKLIFSKSGVLGARHLYVPCGQCIGCRLEYSRQWAARCLHESKMHEFSCFLTLTYDDVHCPSDMSLCKRDVQLFLKRLRKRALPAKIRFFLCGEYGEANSRPHYHVIVFGFYPVDRVFHRKSDAGFDAYTSASMNAVWQNGAVYVGDVSFESAAYVARYCLKKVQSDGKMREIIDPTTGFMPFYRSHEFGLMSLKPGIGASWFNKFRFNVFPRDYVVIRGSKSSVPKYYDSILCRESPLYIAELKAERVSKAECKLMRLHEDFPHLKFGDVRRLKVHEKVKLASIKLLKRG